jgi:hypothetical protein
VDLETVDACGVSNHQLLELTSEELQNLLNSLKSAQKVLKF